MKRMLYAGLLALLFLARTAGAQNHPALDKYLRKVYRRHIIPGFAVTVVEHGKIAYSKGFGVENLGSGKPFTPETVCGIGSLTKSMTALAVLQLAEQQKISLDAPVIHYLSWFRTANKELSDKITVRMLLNNTSGLSSGSTPQGNVSTDKALEDVVRSLSSVYLTKEPGISYQYSNVGFCVAGLIISKVAGVPFDRYLHDNLFKPLKMAHTTTNPQDIDRLKAIEGHYPGIGTAIRARHDRQTDLKGFTPAGSLMVSTTADLGRYLIALTGAGTSNLIPASFQNELWKPGISFPGLTKEDGGDGATFGYGLGWMISNIEGRTLIHHGGSTGKTSSFTMIDPQNGMSATILMNVDLTLIDKYAYPTVFNLINNILRLEMGLPESAYGIPTVPDPTLNAYSIPDTCIYRYTGSFNLKSENVVFIYTGAKMQIRSLPDHTLQCIISRGKQVLYQGLIDFMNESLAVGRSIDFPMQFRFKLTPEGKLTGLFFGDMEFIRTEEVTGGRFQTISAPDRTVSFELPRNWTIRWEGTHFTSANPAGTVHLKGSIRKASAVAPSEDPMAIFQPSCTIQHSGLLHSERFGAYTWKEQSYSCISDGVRGQAVLFTTQVQESVLSLLLMAPEGGLTEQIQQVVNHLLSSCSEIPGQRGAF